MTLLLANFLCIFFSIRGMLLLFARDCVFIALIYMPTGTFVPVVLLNLLLVLCAPLLLIHKSTYFYVALCLMNADVN